MEIAQISYGVMLRRYNKTLYVGLVKPNIIEKSLYKKMKHNRVQVEVIQCNNQRFRSKTIASPDAYWKKWNGKNAQPKQAKR